MARQEFLQEEGGESVKRGLENALRNYLSTSSLDTRVKRNAIVFKCIAVFIPGNEDKSLISQRRIKKSSFGFFSSHI